MNKTELNSTGIRQETGRTCRDTAARVRILRKMLTTAVLTVVLGFSAVANETITLKWESVDSIQKNLSFKFPLGEAFTIDWGAGSPPETFSGDGGNTMTTAQHHYHSNNTYTVTITAATGGSFTEFSCYGQRVISLDVSNCPNLGNLYCYINLLDSLDVSQNTWLDKLNCSHNSLTSLRVNENTTLTDLNCSYNRLDSLNTTRLNQLVTLNCSYNSLVSLSLEKTNKSLAELNCSHNLLTSFDVKTDINLWNMDCSFNQLNSLDVSRNTKLLSLQCSTNQISELDLTNNTSLQMLYCDTNRLLLSDLFAASQTATGDKRLGRQTPLPQIVCIGKVFLPQQSEFNGTPTNYTVTQNGSPAPAGDYTVSNGTIKFNTLGNYTVKMTNAAIVSNPSYPAEVIVDVTVRKAGTDATLIDLIVSEGVLTPDFNSGTLNYVVKVADSISSIIITAIISDSNAIINGDTGIHTLQIEDTTFTITVTAEDDVTTMSYYVVVTRSTIGIGEVGTERATSLRVYPNPTTGKFTIYDLRFDDLQFDDLQFDIYDVVGNLLQSKIVNLKSEMEIDISGLSAGLYFLKVNGKTYKVVKE